MPCNKMRLVKCSICSKSDPVSKRLCTQVTGLSQSSCLLLLQALPPLQLAPLAAKTPLPPLGKAPLQPLQTGASKSIADPDSAPASSRQSSFSFAASNTSSSAASSSKQQLPSTLPVTRQTSDTEKSKPVVLDRATEDAVYHVCASTMSIKSTDILFAPLQLYLWDFDQLHLSHSRVYSDGSTYIALASCKY